LRLVELGKPIEGTQSSRILSDGRARYCVFGGVGCSYWRSRGQHLPSGRTGSILLLPILINLARGAIGCWGGWSCSHAPCSSSRRGGPLRLVDLGRPIEGTQSSRILSDGRTRYCIFGGVGRSYWRSWGQHLPSGRTGSILFLSTLINLARGAIGGWGGWSCSHAPCSSSRRGASLRLVDLGRPIEGTQSSRILSDGRARYCVFGGVGRSYWRSRGHHLPSGRTGSILILSTLINLARGAIGCWGWWSCSHALCSPSRRGASLRLVELGEPIEDTQRSRVLSDGRTRFCGIGRSYWRSRGQHLPSGRTGSILFLPILSNLGRGAIGCWGGWSCGHAPCSSSRRGPSRILTELGRLMRRTRHRCLACARVSGSGLVGHGRCFRRPINVGARDFRVPV